MVVMRKDTRTTRRWSRGVGDGQFIQSSMPKKSLSAGRGQAQYSLKILARE